MDKFFKISERGSTVRKEIIGGLTTFFAMAYIIFVNPNILGEAFGEGYATAIMVATCLSAAIGTLLTAFLANVPFAQAPGMGLNAFFTYSVCLGMGYTWQQGLAIVLISGILFLVITISPLRGKIIASIPAGLKAAIGAGIGLFIALIGLLNAGLVVANGNLLDMGTFSSAAVLAVIGLAITACLMAWKVRGAIFIGIVATTLIGLPMGVTTLPDTWTLSGIGDISMTFLHFDFDLLTLGVMPLVIAVVTFFICDMFDTVGTLIGTAGNAGMLDEDGNLPGGDRALIADAMATCVGACLGTSTVTTFVESSTGISEGARTGLSSVVTGVLFLLATLLAPVAGIIPSAATAPALIIVGVLMLKSAAKIEWDDIEIAIPAFLTIAGMPFFYSISDGIGFGFISYTLIKVVRGKFKEVPVLMYILSVFFLLMYILPYLPF